jgi:Bacterial protein of unknown function (DUF899)
MAEHTIGTREEWQAARDELAKLEAAHAESNGEIKRKRLELPWVPVENEYEFDTEDGKQTLAELFDGRSQSSPTTSCSALTTRLVPAPAAPTLATDPSSRTACAKARVGSRSRAMAGPSTTPTR